MENPDYEQFQHLIAQRLVAKITPRKSTPATDQLAPDGASKGHLSPVEFVKVEKNLASLGFFTPSSKRVRDEKAKIIRFTKVFDGKRVEARATIAPLALYGLPITADQDKYLALQKLITDIQRREGRVVNPVGFTSAELLKLLGHRKSGKRYQEIEEWLKVMVGTSIFSEGTVYFAGQKRWVKDYFHVFERAVAFGHEMPDGTMADQHYVWLSAWQLENINSNYLLPVDLEAYRQLKNHIAKALVPLLQIWLYASRDDGGFKKRYDELCQILNIRQHRPVSLIRQQLAPSLNELQSHGYLADWVIEPTADRKGFKVVFRHGKKFRRDRQHRLGATSTPSRTRAVRPVEAQNSGEGSGDIDAVFLEELTKRGVSRTHAMRVLAQVPGDQPVLDQLEWGDHVVRDGRSKIENPGGFYLSLVRDNITPPESFETSSRRRLREQAAEAHDKAKAEQARLKLAYEGYLKAEVEAHIIAMAPAAYEQHLAEKFEELEIQHSVFRLWPPEQRREIAKTAVRKDLERDLPLLSFGDFCRREKAVQTSETPKSGG